MVTKATRTTWIIDALREALDETVVPSKGRSKAAKTGEERCRHPVNRRIGGMCAVCGEKP
jgi:hypothetical protein